jgi:hypothetical protein
MNTSTSLPGLDLVEVDVEAVREEQRVAGLEVRRDLLAVDGALHLVGQQDHHEVAGLGGLGDLEHPQAGGLGLGPGGWSRGAGRRPRRGPTPWR